LRCLRGGDVEVHAYRVRRERGVVSDRLELSPGEDVEAKYDVNTHADLDLALAEKPDVVLVTNPSSLHVDVARRALEAGAHVLVEKPLSHTLAGVAELLHESQRRGLVGYVAYQLRFHPGFLRAKEILEQGLIGRPLFAEAVVAEYLPGFHPYE